MQEILHVAHNFPIIRFDAAMVLAKKSIRRLWYPEPGHGGDIATRSETGLSTQQFNDAIPNEFWREVVDRVAKECPDTLLLAEAFWMMEGYFVRTLGMHRVYNSAFMNMLKKEENQKYRETVKNTIIFDPQILKRYVNFMNNPDEETAIAQFGDGDKYFGVCTLMITMPGLPMFGHGQIEGFTEKYGMEYTKAYKDEKPSQYLVDRHWKEIFPLMKKRYLFSDVENFLFFDFVQDGHVNENVFAYTNGAGKERVLVVYNNKYDRAYGWIKDSNQYAVKTGNGDEIKLVSRSLAQGLNLNGEDDKFFIFQENKSGLWFIRKSKDICEQGMFIMLNGFEVQVFMNIHQVTDSADGRYRILCDFLNGAGCEDIETAWQELIYKKLYASLKTFTEKAVLPVFKAYKEAANKDDAKPKTKSTAFITVKKLNELTAECKQEAIDFYKEAYKTAGIKGSADKAYTMFKTRLKAVVSILNEKAPKKPADLNKALAKCTELLPFAKLMLLGNENLAAVLLGWTMTADLAEKGFASEWNLGRKFNEFLEQDCRALFQKFMLLAKYADGSKLPADKKEVALSIVSLLTKNKLSGALSGANTFDNVRWFNKEMMENSLNQIELLMLLAAPQTKVPDVFKLFKQINTARIKSAYKCDLFLKQFELPKKKAPVKKATAKKESAKKPATKKKS